MSASGFADLAVRSAGAAACMAATLIVLAGAALMSVIEDTGRVEQVDATDKELLEINARQAAVIEHLVARLAAQRVRAQREEKA